MKFYIYYFFHLLLHTRYRPVIYLLIYILILYLLNWSMVDCMINGNSEPSSPVSDTQTLIDSQVINSLTNENERLRQTQAFLETRINLLNLEREVMGNMLYDQQDQNVLLSQENDSFRIRLANLAAENRQLRERNLELLQQNVELLARRNL